MIALLLEMPNLSINILYIIVLTCKQKEFLHTKMLEIQEDCKRNASLIGEFCPLVSLQLSESLGALKIIILSYGQPTMAKVAILESKCINSIRGYSRTLARVLVYNTLTLTIAIINNYSLQYARLQFYYL